MARCSPQRGRATVRKRKWPVKIQDGNHFSRWLPFLSYVHALIVYSVGTELKRRIEKKNLSSIHIFFQLKGLVVKVSNLRLRGCALPIHNKDC